VTEQAPVIVRFPHEVDDAARQALQLALHHAGLAVSRGLDLGHRGTGDDLVRAAVNVADGIASSIVRIATAARDWLADQPRPQGTRDYVEIEDRTTGTTIRINANDPDRAIRALTSSLTSASDDPITWQGYGWAPHGPAATERDRTVFVIHGRDKRTRCGMFEFLRAIGLHPMEWTEALATTRHGCPHIGDVLDKVLRMGIAVVVLQTPDDIAHLKPEHADDPDDPDLVPRGQARPNVLFEAGMALALFAERTLLVELGKVRPFTDIGGRNVVKLDNTPKKRKWLAQRLTDIGCPVDLRGTDWIESGDLTPPASPDINDRKGDGP